MKILVTGGTGFIGSVLCQRLSSRGDEVWVYSRRPDEVSVRCGSQVRSLAQISDAAQMEFDAVVNLAGESIAGGLWTRRRKQKLRDSRIQLTRDLCSALADSDNPPPVFISASATGIYGDAGDRVLTETSSPAGQVEPDFAQLLCSDWEQAADQALAWGARVSRLRIGLVMGPGGGFLGAIRLPFKLGLGGRLGNGQQWMSWISLEDLVGIILHLLDHEACYGIYNAVSPQPVTNTCFTSIFAECLHRPAFFHVPAFVLRGLLGELSSLLLASQRVVPERLLQSGFLFTHITLEAALHEL